MIDVCLFQEVQKMHEQTAGQVVAFSDRNEMLLSEADAAHVSRSALLFQ